MHLFCVMRQNVPLREGTMELSVNSTARRPKRSGFRFWSWFILFIIALCSAGGTYYWYSVYYPNHDHVEPDLNNMKQPIYYQGAIWKEEGKGTKESLKLPLSFIQEKVDPTVLNEASSDSVIITTKDKVVRLKTNTITGMMNDKAFTLRFPLEKQGNLIYMPIDPLLEYYGLDIRESEDTGIIMIYRSRFLCVHPVGSSSL
ncbi:MAG: glycosyl hydrolase [Paenibacillus sp.]|nr:glycosyl hydrolase [Paenibacillus sp.]